jgi:hypothetical protein
VARRSAWTGAVAEVVRRSFDGAIALKPLGAYRNAR